MSKKDRSLANSRDEAKKIYYQRKEINKLQQENEQLKEELQKADSITQSCILYGGRSSGKTFRESLNLVKQYKSVLDEIREYIDRFNIEYLHEIYEHNLADTLEVIEEILDKVKE